MTISPGREPRTRSRHSQHACSARLPLQRRHAGRAHSLALEVETVSQATSARWRTQTSIDLPVGPDSEKAVLETIADTHVSDPSLLLQDDDIRDSISYWLDELSEKQREVVSRRFGLRGHESSTLEEVGREIGLTRERVRQIQVEALRRLRHLMENQGLTGDSLFN